jgi:hypothetical protein
MTRLFSVLLLCLVLCAGCAVRVVPDAGTAGTIDPKDNSLAITRDDVRITVRVDEPEFISYKVNDTIATFYVQIENLGGREVALDVNSFILLDQDNRQYNALSPEKVKEMVAKDTYYLLPYPYVGFYYLEDYEKSSFQNTFGSNLPYYYDLYPQDIFTRALTEGTVIPGAKAAGLVYFRFEMANAKSVRMLVYRKGATKTKDPEFVFPFKVVK